jgi:Putative peptidase family
MSLRILASSFLLSLLPGCMESGYLVTSLAGDPVAGGQPAQIAALRYTNHRPAATAEEIVPLRIKGSFIPGDRAKILRAVNEWNVALNGFVRFTIEDSGASTSTAGHSRPWSIMAAQGISPRVVPGPTIALAHTQPLPGSGGLMIVYVDRIGTRDLGSVVMHELGHVLGVGHGEKGLMAAHYHPADQQCIDKATIAAVAAKRQLAVDQLNWCETNVASTAR